MATQDSTSDGTESRPPPSRISWSNATQCDPNGKCPSVTINNHGIVVAVYNRGLFSDMWYRVGKRTGNMHGNIVWGDDHKFDDGFYPNVAINDNGTVVEVHESQWRRALFYRVGTVREEDMTITWSKEGSTQYDSGMAPAVALNNKGEVMEVHVTNKLRSYNTFYRVGTLQESSDIMWSDSHLYGEGSRPQVAINDKGTVVEVHEMMQPKYTTAYIVGQIQSSELATADVGWGPMTILGKGSNPHIAINNTNQVVEVHEAGFRDVFYSGGTIHPQAKAVAGISDGKEYENHKLCDGISPAVAMNDDGKIAFVCETSNQLWHTLLCHTGTWPED